MQGTDDCDLWSGMKHVKLALPWRGVSASHRYSVACSDRLVLFILAIVCGIHWGLSARFLLTGLRQVHLGGVIGVHKAAGRYVSEASKWAHAGQEQVVRKNPPEATHAVATSDDGGALGCGAALSCGWCCLQNSSSL